MLARSFLLAAAAGSALAQLQVNTISSLIECQPALISWSGGTAPYFLAVIPGGDPSAAALENFPQQDGNQFTWTVDVAAGTSVTVKITDSTGETNYNSQVTIQKGSDSSCVGSGGNSTAPAGNAGASGAAAGASGASSATGTLPSASSAATAANVAGAQSSGASGSAARASSNPTSASASAASGAAQTSGAAFPLAITDKATGFVAILGALAAYLL